nr:2-oxo acid dehydrogenase subunit E2 [uncultured Amphritea sp.]
MTTETILMPEVDGSGEVIEFCIQPGEQVEIGDAMLVLESDKASMEVPSPISGIVDKWLIELGDSIETGTPLLAINAQSNQLLETSDNKVSMREPDPIAPDNSAVIITQIMLDADGTGEVVEACVAIGDLVSEGDILFVAESDKASMEVPAEHSGVITKLLVDVGSTIDKGTPLIEMQVTDSVEPPEVTTDVLKPVEVAALNTDGNGELKPSEVDFKEPVQQSIKSDGNVFNAGPATRKAAREFGIDLALLSGSGPRGRIMKQDVISFAKQAVKTSIEVGQQPAQSSMTGIPQIPLADFSRYGEIEEKGMSGIAKATSAHMTRCWLNIPHVTLFDEVDISDLEAFRSNLKPEKLGLLRKPTILPFIVMITAKALKAHQQFNVSIDSANNKIIQKAYINIGIAIDSPSGLVVPVIRNADQKSIVELANEIIELTSLARERKLKPEQMQGGNFTISSLGPTGGTGFTPIVNGPEVAILGIARSTVKPSWDGSKFEPSVMLPLCLSFDHRAINGGDAGRFMGFIHEALVDIRNNLL